MGRSPCCEKAHTNKGAWTKEEDQLLINYIRKHGEGSWRSLPKSAGPTNQLKPKTESNNTNNSSSSMITDNNVTTTQQQQQQVVVEEEEVNLELGIGIGSIRVELSHNSAESKLRNNYYNNTYNYPVVMHAHDS
ncbi:hypothetical protein ACFE04_004242 [Oxalis oulophora]